MNPIDRAEAELQTQRTILFGQREGLRAAEGRTWTRERPAFWRAAIAATERRIAKAESRLARARQEITIGKHGAEGKPAPANSKPGKSRS